MQRLLVISMLVSTLVGLALAEEPEVYRLRLRDQAVFHGQAVTVSDVLVLESGSPELVARLADQPVGQAAAAQPETTVTHEQIVRRLDELGVNMARVLVGGALSCRARRQSLAPTTDAAQAEAPLLRPVEGTTDDGARTLAELLRAHVNSELRRLGGQAELRFERAGEEFLRLTTPPWEFSITSAGRERLGLREFRVLIRRDGQTQRRVQVYAHARLTREVVVARRPLNPGNFVRRDDVALETRVFDAGEDSGLGGLEAAVGQQVKSFVAVGEVVPQAALKSVDLVRRSRPVTVINGDSAVQVRLTGTALDSGGFGDSVRVRVGSARRDQRVLRGVVTGLGTVRLSEGDS